MERKWSGEFCQRATHISEKTKGAFELQRSSDYLGVVTREFCEGRRFLGHNMRILMPNTSFQRTPTRGGWCPLNSDR